MPGRDPLSLESFWLDRFTGCRYAADMLKIKGRLVIGVLIFLGLILALSLVFFIRAPVVFVSDDWFLRLYGPARNSTSRIISSIQLFRPVRELRFSELMDTQTMSETIQAFSKRTPYLVVFPERYRQIAALWEDSEITIPFVVLDSSVYTDVQLDLYRAGALSALLAQNAGPVGLFALPDTDAVLLDAFKAGYLSANGDSDVLYVPAAASSIEYACVTVFHSDAAVVSRIKSNQLIVFSWADPNYFGSNLLYVFDNSPWHLLVPVIKSFKNNEPIKLSSRVHILHSSHFGDSISRDLKEALTVQMPKYE